MNNPDFKCDKCGKTFSSQRDTDRHRNRIRPCIISKAEAIRDKLHMCDFCDKVYKQKCHLSRHLKVCKSKGIETPKVEKKPSLRDEVEELKNIIIELQNRLASTNNGQLIINGNVQVGNNTVNNTQVNNYLKPNIDDIDYTSEELRETHSIMSKIIRKVWGAIGKPENHSIEPVNKKTGQVRVYDGTGWRLCGREEFKNEVMGRFLLAAWELGVKIINGDNGPYGGLDENFVRLCPVDQNKIQTFNERKEVFNYGDLMNTLEQAAQDLKNYGKTLRVEQN